MNNIELLRNALADHQAVMKGLQEMLPQISAVAR